MDFKKQRWYHKFKLCDFLYSQKSASHLSVGRRLQKQQYQILVHAICPTDLPVYHIVPPCLPRPLPPGPGCRCWGSRFGTSIGAEWRPCVAVTLLSKLVVTRTRDLPRQLTQARMFHHTQTRNIHHSIAFKRSHWSTANILQK